jgi:hypothetical protein
MLTARHARNVYSFLDLTVSAAACSFAAALFTLGPRQSKMGQTGLAGEELFATSEANLLSAEPIQGKAGQALETPPLSAHCKISSSAMLQPLSEPYSHSPHCVHPRWTSRMQRKGSTPLGTLPLGIWRGNSEAVSTRNARRYGDAGEPRCLAKSPLIKNALQR